MRLWAIRLNPFGSMNIKVKLSIIYPHNVVINLANFLMRTAISFVRPTAVLRGRATEGAVIFFRFE
jgi:hypothetical protein